MPSLKKIIRNIDSYTPEQLAQFVLDGDCTIYELNKSGHITPLVKRQIESLVAAGNVRPAASEAAEPQLQTQVQPEAGGMPDNHEIPGEPRTQLVTEIPAYDSGHTPPPPVWPQPDPDTSPAMRGMVRDMPPTPPADGTDTGSFKAGHVFKPVSLFD